MSRVRTSAIHISALNLVLQPHTPERYIEMLLTMAAGKFDSKIRGDEALLLGSCGLLNKYNPSEGVRGELYKFLKLDATEAWFNLKDMGEATDEDVADLVIPDHLKPHFKRFQYIFLPKGHRFYFVSGKPKHSLSPQLVKNFFLKVFARPEFSDFGQLSITVQPDPNSLDRILALKRISKLKLEIDRPNPDDHEDLEGDILERLNRMNARTQKIEFLEASNTGLVIDNDVKALAGVAEENGYVMVEGKDEDNVKQYLSTKDTPLHVIAKYNPNLSSEFDAFYEKVIEVHGEILR
ncbi:DUF4747 family protein [Metapseudomonas otitidis]|uniref:DUF4747 family protein n=1 Tax=Metapseudomonas otitidis TaxID=319939 RepID=UPI003CF70ABE